MRRFILLAYVLAAMPAFAGDEKMPRTITVTGSGKAEGVPDQALLPVTIETKNRALKAAKRENDELTDKLIKAADKLDIDKKRIATTSLYVNPEYRYDKQGRALFERYVVSRSIRITIEKLENAEPLIAALTEAGIDKVQGLSFTFSDPEALASEARKKAAASARRKAEDLATGTGAKLGKVLAISQQGGGNYPMPIVAAPRAMMTVADAEGKMAEPPPALPGLATVEETVSVTYELD